MFMSSVHLIMPLNLPSCPPPYSSQSSTHQPPPSTGWSSSLILFVSPSLKSSTRPPPPPLGLIRLFHPSPGLEGDWRGINPSQLRWRFNSTHSSSIHLPQPNSPLACSHPSFAIPPPQGRSTSFSVALVPSSPSSPHARTRILLPAWCPTVKRILVVSSFSRSPPCCHV
jgi:hypothetical protein